MSDDEPRRVAAKFIAVMLVAVWLLIMGGVAFELAVAPPHFMAFTALVFLLVGRLWNLEVQKLLPGGYGGDSNSDSSDD